MTFRHEGANDGIAADGRAAAVMGDQGNEFIYRFISRNRCRPGSSLAD